MAVVAAELAPPRSSRAADLRSFLLLAVLCLPALVPLAVVLSAVLTPEVEVWSHLLQYVLPEVIANTIVLVVGVSLGAAVLGTLLAWVTSACEFPGRRFFEWALLLPLAMPAYVLAFIAIGYLDYAGPLQSWLREVFGSSRWVPPIRSTGGVIAVLTLSLYPYVYLLARAAFLSQGRRAQEAARSLGMSAARAWWRVVLPMARPWIVAGAALVAMETLADFGAVSVFNYDTLTTTMYRAWFGMFSVNAALELAAVLLVFVLIVFAFERRARAGLRFATTRDLSQQAPRIRLRGARATLATCFAAVVFGLGFFFPVLQLVLWVVERAAMDLDARYFEFVMHSVVLATSAALIISAASLLVAYLERHHGTLMVKLLVRIATSGYAIPGTVLAIGIVVPIIGVNNTLQSWLSAWLGPSAPALLLQGTLITVLLAYFARFLAVGFNPVESGLNRITAAIDEAAVSLGAAGFQLVRRVHVPLLRTSLMTAAILVFVDVMKEMPITLIARPFGWDTLAVRVFEMTSEGEWERAALPALAIVLVGLIPAALLTPRGEHVA
ncbi:MAG: iron ABC transporter permease [Gammaproteobacteria bacterium]|nr:ABC transporter permease [Gammaproteobacteria bacterium]